MKEHFRVIARRETEYWDAETLAKHEIREAFGLYLYREGERTHICSLTPNSRADFIRNAFIGGEDSDHDLEYEGDLPGTSSYFGLISHPDPRFVSERITVNVDGRRKDYQEAVWDAVQEDSYFPEPDILDPGVFDKWQHEQLLKARAENRPALGLPLFNHAVSSYEEARALNWI